MRPTVCNVCHPTRRARPHTVCKVCHSGRDPDFHGMRPTVCNVCHSARRAATGHSVQGVQFDALRVATDDRRLATGHWPLATGDRH